MHADQWSAVGQVGAFLVAIAALIFALVSRKDSKKAIRQAERSATAAEESARAAKEANELTTTEMNGRAIARAREDFRQAVLVRGAITWRSGTGIGKPGRTMTRELRARVENDSNVPALDVRYQHVDHAPGWRPLASIIRAGDVAEVAFDVPVAFETSEDHRDLIAGTMIAYDLGGNHWLRRGTSEPMPDPGAP